MKSAPALILFAFASTLGACSPAKPVRPDQSAAIAAPPPTQSIATQNAETIRKDPHLGASLNVLASIYPQDYGRHIASLDAAIQPGMSSAQIWTLSSDNMSAIVASKRHNIAHAPDQSLVGYLALQLQLALSLRENDPAGCDAVFKRLITPEMQLSLRSRELMGDMGASLLRAAKAGELHPVQREGLVVADLRAWGQQMLQDGGTPQMLNLLDDPALRAAAAAEDLCQLRVVMFTAASHLPAPLAAKIVAAQTSKL